MLLPPRFKVKAIKSGTHVILVTYFRTERGGGGRGGAEKNAALNSTFKCGCDTLKPGHLKYTGSSLALGTKAGNHWLNFKQLPAYPN